MHIRELAGKSICVLGYGTEGKATVKALETFAEDCEITIADQNPNTSDPTGKHWLQVGPDWLQNLEKFDVIIKSPGIKPLPELRPHGKHITSATQIFLDTVAEKKSMTIGVTGSKGKSTTASLIYEILKADKRETFLLGNIGSPALEKLSKATSETIFVLEMSSYQLMDLTCSPHIAVITSFFPEHLDYHGSVAAYLEAKRNITRYQTKGDTVFFNRLYEGAKKIVAKSKAWKVPFSPKDAPHPIEKTHLLGIHNLGNIAAAYKVAHLLSVSQRICMGVFKEFRGLPHRLQSLGVIDDIEWVDDSISTTPESAIAALDALGNRVSAMILGGQDRGYNFENLGKRIAQSNLRSIALLGESGKRIRSAIESETTAISLQEAKTMEEAVDFVRKSMKEVTTLPPIILLSPASPSYDMFKNFEERGRLFADAIRR